MNENKHSRFWKWAVVLLVLCNFCLIGVIWFKPPMPLGNHPGSPRDYVISKLKFSDDQVKKYDVLIAAHRAAMDRLRIESADLRRQFFNTLNNNNNTNVADSFATLIGNNQKQIELFTYNHFAQVRALCSDDQKAVFDKIIGDVTRMMNGPRPGPGGRHPGDGQGPPPPDGPPNGRPGPPEND